MVCLDMAGVSTIIKNPETKEPKTFAFDFSYWSHDGFKEGPDGELIPLNDKYATQQKVFNDLGQDVLTSAYDGYNSTLFAYGQTGAGSVKDDNCSTRRATSTGWHQAVLLRVIPTHVCHLCASFLPLPSPLPLPPLSVSRFRWSATV